MNYINLGIEFLKVNWITIGLIIAALIIILQAVAKFKVRWAKVTPDKADDIEAELFAKKTNVIIQFLKDIFLPSKKKKNDGGFIELGLGSLAIVFILGLLIGAVLLAKFRPAEKVTVSVPEFIEVQKIVHVESVKKEGKTTTTKEFNCPDGGVSKEVSVTESSEQSQSQLAKESVKESEELKDEKLDILLGAGAQIETGEKLRDIVKVNPQLAGGLTYEKYGGFAASDFNKSHAIYGFRKWSF